MLNSKQRKYLKSLANTIEPKINIGKNGISENLITQINDTLIASELVKIKILNNSLEDHDEMIDAIIEKTNSDLVSHMGNKFVIFKQSKEKIIKLP